MGVEVHYYSVVQQENHAPYGFWRANFASIDDAHAQVEADRAAGQVPFVICQPSDDTFSPDSYDPAAFSMIEVLDQEVLDGVS